MSELKRGPKRTAKSTGKIDKRVRDRKGNGSDHRGVKAAK